MHTWWYRQQHSHDYAGNKLLSHEDVIQLINKGLLEESIH